MSEKRSYDAVVIGGGVIGLSCAWRLAQRGAAVAVVEKAKPPAGATRVSAGMLAPIGELTFGEPELLRMTLESRSLYADFVAELEVATGMSTGYRHQGALHVALDRDEAVELRRIHELQRSLGLEAEWLTPRRCRELEPGLSPSCAGGVYAEGEACLDPRALAAVLLAGLRDRGVEVLTESEVEQGLFDGERLVGVRLDSGRELRAAAVVLASGAWSGQPEWLPSSARPPVRPVKGQIIELRAIEGPAPCERIIGAERVYLVPRPDGRLIAGATVEEQGFDSTITAGAVHEILREAYRLLPDIAEMEMIEPAVGLRPGTPDNLPFIGPGPMDGLVWATGHYRNGVLLAPLTADAVAGLLESGDLPESVAAANPARLASDAAELAR